MKILLLLKRNLWSKSIIIFCWCSFQRLKEFTLSISLLSCPRKHLYYACRIIYCRVQRQQKWKKKTNKNSHFAQDQRAREAREKLKELQIKKIVTIFGLFSLAFIFLFFFFSILFSLERSSVSCCLSPLAVHFFFNFFVLLEFRNARFSWAILFFSQQKKKTTKDSKR